MGVEIMERKIRLKSVNKHITCGLCKGYLIDATTITECLHTFCKTCLVRFLEENNKCPNCQIVIHQSYPLNFISFDRTMQDIVYKLVPKLQEKELKRQEEYFKKLGQLPPKVVPVGNNVDGERKVQITEEERDCHRTDEQVNICLECKGNHMRFLKRKYIRISAQATITHLKKFISLKVYHTHERYKDVDILCKDELLGKDHTLKFIHATRWRLETAPLMLHYRQRLTEL